MWFTDAVADEIFEDKDFSGERASFQYELEQIALSTFKLLGTTLKPAVFLLTIWKPGETRWDNQPYTLIESGFCKIRSRVLWDAVKNIQLPNPDLRAWDDFMIALGQCRDQIHTVIGTVLTQKLNGREYFHTRPVFGPQYLHILCLHFDQTAWNEYQGASLPTNLHATSLLRATVQEILDAGITGLGSQPAANDPWFTIGPQEIARRAALTLVDSAALMAWQQRCPGLFEEMDALSSKRYEGQVSRGRIMLTKAHQSIVEFSPAVPIQRDHNRKIRKLLEMAAAKPSLCLMAQAGLISGLGQGDVTAENGLESISVDFVGPHRWELRYGDKPLMRMVDGWPLYPQPRIADTTFKTVVRELFFKTDGNDEAAALLWQLVDKAMEQKHGTLIVIAQDARDEASRLIGQSVPVEPVRLRPEDILAVSSIDGAILMDPEGTCYALGVILDGKARQHQGDSGRGARYNSAVRYVELARRGSRLAIIVSEDGMVDLRWKGWPRL